MEIELDAKIMKFRKFLKNTSGNMAIMFSLAAIPILISAGVAVDSVRRNSANAALQAATDAAALAAVSGKKARLNNHKIEEAVQSYLASNNADSTVVAVSVKDYGFDHDNKVYHVKMTGKIKSMFMGMVGYPTMDIGAYSEVDIGSSALEVALVLDTTGSMNQQGRLDGLKVAAKDLVQQLFQDSDPSSYLKVGVVPFSNYVNVGLNNRNKTWLNVPADFTDPQSCGNTYPNATYGNCHMVTSTWQSCSGGGDGVPPTCTTQTGSSNQCDVISYGNAVQQCWPGAQHTWHGLVGSRSSDDDISGLEKYPGLMDMSGPNQITDLTNNQGQVISAIETLAANGETYIPSGLLWGWNLLDSNEPYSSAKTKASMAASNGVKAIVLMTDGDNTKSLSGIQHEGTDAAAADAKTAQICSKIKADGITVYTIAFKVSKASSLQLLKNCATDSSYAFDAQDNNALQTVFNQIAGSLATLRLTK
jgi:Flp pilus assembly protein TadG